MPGLVLDEADAGSSFTAPWWAPDAWKEPAFEKLCSRDHSPTTLGWFKDGNANRLVVKTNDKTVYAKKGLTMVETFGDRLRLWNRKSMAEDKMGLWSM